MLPLTNYVGQLDLIRKIPRDRRYINIRGLCDFAAMTLTRVGGDRVLWSVATMHL